MKGNYWCLVMAGKSPKKYEYNYQRIPLRPKAYYRLKLLKKILKMPSYSELIIKLCDEQVKKLYMLKKNNELPEYLEDTIDWKLVKDYIELMELRDR